MSTGRFTSYNRSLVLFSVLGLMSSVSPASAQTTLFAPGGSVGNITGGNVGIGTSSPATSLDVNGSLLVTGGATGAGTYSVKAIGAAGADRDIFLAGAAGLSNGFTVQRVGSAMKYVFNDGNVGIGTTSLAGRLHLQLNDSTSQSQQVIQADGNPCLIIGQFGSAKSGTTFGVNNAGASFVASSTLGSGYPTSLLVGTVVPAPLVFGTNSAERVRIDASGNVGIGTANPGATFEVYRVNGGAPSFRLNTGFSGGNAVDLNPFITGISNGGFELSVAGTQRLVVSTTGNVGIGTTSPNARLTVADSSNLFPLMVVGNSSASGVAIGTGGTGVPTINGYLTNFGTTANLALQPNGGNVGIGTTNIGSYKLAVEGSIRARSVVVDNATWPDFVFDETYRLAPLSEVEAHIKAEKHLPGIPSAIEVAQGGVSLGDMQAKLLAKVEELTLHMIALKKENDDLKLRVTQLESSSKP